MAKQHICSNFHTSTLSNLRFFTAGCLHASYWFSSYWNQINCIHLDNDLSCKICKVHFWKLGISSWRFQPIWKIRRPLCLAWGGGVREELQSLILDSTAAVASPCMPLSIHGIHIIHARLRHVCCHLPGAFYFSFNGFKSALSAQCGRVAKATFLACWGSPVS